MDSQQQSVSSSSSSSSSSETQQRKIKLTKRIDKLNFSKWHILMITSLGTTWIFDGYEVAMLSLVQIKLESYFNKTPSQIGLIASLYLIGCCSGALIFGSLAHNFGRKKLFSITLILYIFSVLGAAVSTNYVEFIIFRMITGLSVGGEYTAIFAAVDEFIPPQNRGYTDVVIDGTWHFGSCLSSIFAIIIFSIWDDYTYSWRLLFIFGIIGAILVIFLRKNIPESPRWLILKGKYRQAQKIIDFIEYQCVQKKIINQEDFDQIQAERLQQDNEQEGKEQYIEEIDEHQIDNSTVCEQLTQIMYMLCKVYPKRFILGATLMSCQAFFYQGIFYTFSMNLHTFYNIDENKTGYYVIPLSVASFMGPVLLGKYFDTIGRKKMVLITYLFVAFMLTFMAILFQSESLPIAALMIFLTIIFIVASPGASSAHLIVSEIFPSEMRSQVLAIFFAVGFGSGGVIAPYIFGLLIEQNERSYLAIGYYISAFLMLVGGLVGYFLGIDSENKSLEEISSFQQQDDQKQKLEENQHLRSISLQNQQDAI